MAKRRRTQPAATGKTHGVINGAGEVVEQNIDSTIREKLYALRNERYSFPCYPRN